MDCLDKDIKELLSVSADLLSIFGITVVSIWTAFYTIFKRNRNYVATMVSLYLAYFVKSSMIFFIVVFVGVFAWELINAFAFIQRQPFIFSLAIVFLVGSISIVFIWLIGTVLWTLSFSHLFDFMRVLGFKFEHKFPKLEILYAWYGTKSQNIDVTNILSDYIINGKLKIKASNDLAGDPHVNISKKMVVKYRMDSHINTIEVNENEILELPLKDFVNSN